MTTAVRSSSAPLSISRCTMTSAGSSASDATRSSTSLGDSPVLSTGITEVTRPAYLGSTLAVRGVLGCGAGAIAPLVFGMVIDATNPAGQPPTEWGWAFVVLGVGGLLATICAYLLPRDLRREGPR